MKYSVSMYRFLLVSALVLSASLRAQSSGGWSTNWNSNLSFIENKGQFYVREGKTSDKPVLYGVDASFSRIFFHRNGVTFNFTQKLRPVHDENEEHKEPVRSEKEWREREAEEHRAVLRTDEVGYTWEGANPDCQVIAEDVTPDYFSYSFYSAGKEKNENFIKAYRKLTYKNIYPNVDIVYTIHPDGGIKYAIVVHPGGDLSQVRMKYNGRPYIDAQGNVLVGTHFGDIIDHAPVTFYDGQEGEGITSWYICDKNIISFGLGECDHSKTIVIDPWTQTPALPNSNKVWECETSSAGDVFAYGGDSFIKLIKYNSAGTVQWTYTSPWDSANYWIGGFITHPTSGESYMTSGSNGEIRKISTAGGVVWSNNPNSLTSYEYWSLAFTCDLTQLVVGGSRAQFSIPTPILRGVMININLSNGSQSGVTVVGYGSTVSFPPSVQEVSSVCYGPNNKLYFLTLDTVGCINNSLSTVSFKVPTSYAFDYYIPGYGFGTKQPISATRASSSYLYTISGTTIHKRDLTTGAVLGTASIPGGQMTATFGGRFVNGNGGIDIDANGNVYVGLTNGVTKFDANLNVVQTIATTFAVYDVDVNNNGEVIACGWSGGTGKIQSIPFSAGAQVTYSCTSNSPLSASSAQTNVNCFGSCTGSATATPSGGTSPYTYSWLPTGGNAATATGLCAGTYTCTITDATPQTTSVTVTITQPASALSATGTQTNASCSGGTGSATVTATGGTASYTYAWAPSGGSAASATGLSPGGYTCTITDANGCSTTQSFSITAPSALSATGTQTNATCNGGTGSASVTATGGTPVYTYAWLPSGGNGSSATGLVANNYTCTITDGNGCTTTQSFSITAPTAVTGTTTSTPATCGNNNGTAAVTPAGGAGGYTYLWAPTGGNGSSASNLASGNYTCTITDASGCTGTATVNVSSSGGPATSVQSFTDVSCNGGNDGTGTITATGSGPFTYSWAPAGGTGVSASNLIAGIYTVTVTDNNGCSSTQTVSISEPTAVAPSISSFTDATCGNNDGSATATATGGTGTYSYSWAPSGGTAATENNMGAGIYTVTVTDANGCSATTTVNISNIGAPVVTIQSQADASCFGMTDGTATLSASGNGPFTYSWSPTGGTNATANNLGAGIYTVTVTDNGGCTSIQNVTITEPTAIAGSVVATDATCGNTNGTASVTPTGGTGPYTFTWSNTQTSQQITGLAAGTYSVVITDANGCTTSASGIVNNSNGPAVALTSSADVTCFGQSTGSATVNASGGSSPYTYSWSPSGGNAATASSLPAGTYTCVVTDNNGCSQTQTVTITQPAALSVTSTSSPDNCNSQSGSAAVSVTGGTAAYTYLWNTGSGNDSIAGLTAGTYTCAITDANGCTALATVAVGSAGSATANAGSDVTINMGQSTILNGSGGSIYSWTPPGSLDCATCQNPTASPTVTTTYILTVTDTAGCTDTDTITVFVDLECGEVWVPNAFSPNNDGENDVFYVRGNCIETMQLEIYNRWGELVFTSDDPAHGWDGTWRDKPCEAAVFTYFLRGATLDGNEFEMQGNISLTK